MNFEYLLSVEYILKVGFYTVLTLIAVILFDELRSPNGIEG